MNRIKTTVLPRAGPVVFQSSRSRDLDGQPNNGFMQQRHSRKERRGEVREDGRMERSPRRLFRSQGLHLPEGEDAGVGNYFLECVRPAADWPEPINNLPNRISHEVSSCPFPKRSVVRMNHNDSSTTLRRIIRAKRNCKGPRRKIPKIFSSRLFAGENSLVSDQFHPSRAAWPSGTGNPRVRSGKCGSVCDAGLRGGGGWRLGEARTAPCPNSVGFSSPNRWTRSRDELAATIEVKRP